MILSYHRPVVGTFERMGGPTREGKRRVEGSGMAASRQRGGTGRPRRGPRPRGPCRGECHGQGLGRGRRRRGSGRATASSPCRTTARRPASRLGHRLGRGPCQRSRRQAGGRPRRWRRATARASIPTGRPSSIASADLRDVQPRRGRTRRQTPRPAPFPRQAEPRLAQPCHDNTCQAMARRVLQR